MTTDSPPWPMIIEWARRLEAIDRLRAGLVISHEMHKTLLAQLNPEGPGWPAKPTRLTFSAIYLDRIMSLDLEPPVTEAIIAKLKDWVGPEFRKVKRFGHDLDSWLVGVRPGDIGQFALDHDTLFIVAASATEG